MFKALAGLIAAALLASAGSAHAEPQIYDPQTGGSPLVLLKAPADGLAYFRRRGQARSLVDKQRWAEAEPILAGLVHDYARDPETWLWLGDAKRNLKKPAEAADAYEHCADLLGLGTVISPWGPPINLANREAGMYLAAGDKAKALEVLRKVIVEDRNWQKYALRDNPYFAAIKDDPDFLKLIGPLDAGNLSREDGWKADIDYLRDELKETSPYYHDRPFPAEVQKRLDDLYASYRSLSDEEIFYRMQRVLAPLRQGHTQLWAAEAPNARYLPLRFYAFAEGVFIIDADQAHRGLVGAKVLQIGSLPAEEALRRVAEARSADGPMEYLTTTSRLAETYWLKGMGAITGGDEAKLQFQGLDGRRRTLVVPTQAKPLDGSEDMLAAPRSGPVPLYLSRLDRMFWDQPLTGHDAYYVQMNRTLDDKDETLQHYGARLRTALAASGARNLVIDLRHNDGGVDEWAREFLRTVIGFSAQPDHHVYVLMGRRTYSAAGFILNQLEAFADPVFIGEASGECCSIHAPARRIRMPYSHITGYLATYHWPLGEPTDKRREMSPHLPVQITAADYFAGRDPVLDAALALIDAPSAAPLAKPAAAD